MARFPLAGVKVMIFHQLRADARRLTATERRWLARAAFGPARRAEWIRGRLAAHHLLPAGASVLAARDGAPRLRGGAGCALSISHEGPWVAVATLARTVTPAASAS